MQSIDIDSVAGLRRIRQPRPVRVLAVGSGKGGVGKTNVSVNLAIALAALGKKTMLLDADLGLANTDVLLGLNPTHNLSHVVDGQRTLEEIIVTGPAGVQIVPASSGVKEMAELGVAGQAGLIRAFSELSHDLDMLLVDTAAGVSSSVLTFMAAAQEAVIVVCDEPASITDAYALIKLLSREYGMRRFRIVANMARSVFEGRELFDKLQRVTDRFLDVALHYFGAVPQDDYLRRAVQRQRAVVDAYPRSRAALAFRKLARKATEWPAPDVPCGHLEFFVERLIRPGKPMLKLL